MTKDVSFVEFQDFSRCCYEKVNNRNYSNSKIGGKLQKYATLGTKRIRLGLTREVGPNLAITMAWVVALANRIMINLDSTEGGEIWKRYPGLCPHCESPQCLCRSKRSAESAGNAKLIFRVKPASIRSIRSFQEMFASIYPENRSATSCYHLHEEIVEAREAVDIYDETHDPDIFQEIVKELVDVIAHLFAVASTNGIDLGAEISALFRNDRCYKCHQAECNCGFIVATPITARDLVA